MSACVCVCVCVCVDVNRCFMGYDSINIMWTAASLYVAILITNVLVSSAGYKCHSRPLKTEGV